MLIAASNRMCNDIADELNAEVRAIFQTNWDKRNGLKVPNTENVQLLGNQAVLLEGTVLYADLAESTNLVTQYSPNSPPRFTRPPPLRCQSH